MPLADAAVRVPPGVEAGFDAAVTGAVFTKTGLLAAALGDGTVQLVGPESGVRTVQAHEGAALCLVLDLDGQAVLTGGDDGTVVRTSTDGTRTQLMAAPGRQIDIMTASPAAKARAVAVGKEVWLIDGGGKVRARSADHPSTVSGLSFNPKGKRLAVAHYGGVTLWWVTSLGQTPTRLAWRGSHISVCWSPDGAHLMTAMQECELHGWRVADGDHMTMRGYSAKVRSMDWLAKPPTLVTAGADCVIAWPFAGSGPQGKPPLELGQGIGRLVTTVAVHPDRPLVAAGFDDGRVAVCELNADRESRALRLRPGDGGRVSALTWSPDGKRLAVGTELGMLAVFDLSRPAP